MKKIAKILLVLALSFVFLLGSKMDFYAASASLSGPSTVRAGDTITLKLNVSDNGKYGLEGSLSYDSSQVTLSDISCNVSGWKVERNGNAIIVYDDALSNPLSGNKTVLTLKFKVNSNVATGAKVSIAVNSIVTTDGSAESNIGAATYSTTIAAPLSTNANLSSLSVSEGTLSPAFKAGTTSYSIGEVPFSVSKLNITYKTEDAKAKVTISGNSLSVGSNTVSIVVKAENGATKTYKISVTRKQDPNYVASSNAALSSITISSGTISPTFSSEKTDYIVYLPFEYVGKEFSVTGKAADSKASGVTGGNIAALVEGVNNTKVVCKAENGAEKTYKITVVVMPQYNGAVPNIEGVESVPTPPEPGNTEIEDTETENSEFEQSTENDSSNDSTQDKEEDGIGGVIAVIVIIILIGALIYVLFFLNKRNFH